MTAIIEDKFFLFKNKYFQYNVKLTLDSLTYTSCANHQQNAIFQEKVNNIVGCALMKLRKEKDRHEVYIAIYSYPLLGNKRKRKKVIFEVSSKDSFEENLNIANRWRSLLYYAMYYCEQFGKEKPPQPIYKYHKKILIIINPKSGPGTALQAYEKTFKPVLAEAEVEQDVVITDHANHAYELVQHMDLSSYAGIVAVAGDGLIFEIYNGLFLRNDGHDAISFPIGVVPGGSGNGMARSLAHLINEPYLSNPVLVSSLNIVNPVVTPMDLVLLQTQKGHKYVSFLSIGCGIMSDIDIESERLRKVGELRFSLYGLARVLNMRKYRARLSYKVAHDVAAKSFSARVKPTLSRSQTVEENSNESWTLPERSNSVTYENGVDPSEVEFPNSKLVGSITNLSWIETDLVERLPDRAEKKDFHSIGPSANSVCKDASFLDRIPDDWVTIEDEFVSIYAVSLPFIASKAFFSPRSALNDGVMWLSYIRGNTSKANVAKFMMSIDSGTHMEVPGVVYVPVTELQLVPLSRSGKITVDGELIDFEPLHAVVIPSKGRVLVRRP